MKYKIKLIKLNLDGGGKHIAVRSTINGAKTVLIIDTGASNSIFDMNNEIFEKEKISDVSDLGIGSGFNSSIPELGRGIINSISLGRLKLKNVSAVFTPMDHINELYRGLKLPVIAGLLGSDFLFKHNAIVDFENKVLSLEKN